MTATETSARVALRPVADALANDGYTMSVEEEPDGALLVRIGATANACQDCLAPKGVLQPIMEDLLKSAEVFAPRVQVRYPNM